MLIIFIVVVFFWFLPAELLLTLSEVGGSEMWSPTIFSCFSYILGILLIIGIILHNFVFL